MKIVVIEDEPLTAEDLISTIGSLRQDAQIVAVLSSVVESCQWFSEGHEADLIFSDVQLLDGPSFSIFRQYPPAVPVIFCTAFNEFAIDAFKANGIDYILKPFSKDAIVAAFAKYDALKRNFSAKASDEKNDFAALLNVLESRRKIGSVLVYYKDKILPVRLDDVAIFYKENEITYLITSSGKKYTIEQTLDALEELCGAAFFRVNRPFLVNHAAIQETSQLFNRKLLVHLTVNTGFEVDVSRAKVPAFLEWLTKIN